MIALSKIVKKIQCVVPLITPNYHFILHALIDNMKFMIETVFFVWYDIIKLNIYSFTILQGLLERNEVDEKAMDKVLFTTDERCYDKLAYRFC